MWSNGTFFYCLCESKLLELKKTLVEYSKAEDMQILWTSHFNLVNVYAREMYKHKYSAEMCIE